MQNVLSSIRNLGVRDVGFLDLALLGELRIKSKKKKFTPSTLTACMVKMMNYFSSS